MTYIGELLLYFMLVLVGFALGCFRTERQTWQAFHDEMDSMEGETDDNKALVRLLTIQSLYQRLRRVFL